MGNRATSNKEEVLSFFKLIEHYRNLYTIYQAGNFNAYEIRRDVIEPFVQKQNEKIEAKLEDFVNSQFSLVDGEVDGNIDEVFDLSTRLISFSREQEVEGLLHDEAEIPAIIENFEQKDPELRDVLNFIRSLEQELETEILYTPEPNLIIEKPFTHFEFVTNVAKGLGEFIDYCEQQYMNKTIFGNKIAKAEKLVSNKADHLETVGENGRYDNGRRYESDFNYLLRILDFNDHGEGLTFSNLAERYENVKGKFLKGKDDKKFITKVEDTFGANDKDATINKINAQLRDVTFYREEQGNYQSALAEYQEACDELNKLKTIESTWDYAENYLKNIDFDTIMTKSIQDVAQIFINSPEALAVLTDLSSDTPVELDACPKQIKTVQELASYLDSFEDATKTAIGSFGALPKTNMNMRLPAKFEFTTPVGLERENAQKFSILSQIIMQGVLNTIELFENDPSCTSLADAVSKGAMDNYVAQVLISTTLSADNEEEPSVEVVDNEEVSSDLHEEFAVSSGEEKISAYQGLGLQTLAVRPDPQAVSQAISEITGSVSENDEFTTGLEDKGARSFSTKWSEPSNFIEDTVLDKTGFIQSVRLVLHSMMTGRHSAALAHINKLRQSS